ncbi:MAG: hypothetical protein KF833_18535 [Verrucomicrobiae bacterium]|nr:hypothetical protein [Verrucomicrobiae bacterium]
MNPIETWCFRKRLEWAAQLALAKVLEDVEPEASLTEVLVWCLVDSWHTDGCVAFWNNAERGGKPHPENPDGLHPI